jgi:hypothetical protein
MTSISSKTNAGLGFFMATGIFLNVFIPKGGFYLGSLPLTWGYLYLAPVFLWNIANLFFVGRLSILRLIAFLSCLPFLAAVAWTLGFRGDDDFGSTIALFVSFGFVPLLIYIALDSRLSKETVEKSLRYAAAGFVYVAAFGIVMFAIAAITRSPPDIPFITTGGGADLTSLDRNNDRGAFFKLTSTFNNGNIYAVCALMILPLVARFEAGWKAILIEVSLILTLSRTAWAGLLLYEFGYLIWFARGRNAVLRSAVIIGVALTAIIFALFVILQNDFAFLFDPNLGGRISTFEDMGGIYPFSLGVFDGIREIVYVSILDKFGYLGLAAFLLAMIAPIACRIMQNRPLDLTERSIAFGMFLYLALCWSDGAILLIPVMLFYWSLASCLLAPEPCADAVRRETFAANSVTA